MIHPESIMEYRKAFSDENCWYAVPSSLVMVTSPEDKSYLSPIDEDDETFLDRVKRSQEAGRNLFYEEWPEHVSEPGVWY